MKEFERGKGKDDIATQEHASVCTALYFDPPFLIPLPSSLPPCLHSSLSPIFPLFLPPVPLFHRTNGYCRGLVKAIFTAT